MESIYIVSLTAKRVSSGSKVRPASARVGGSTAHSKHDSLSDLVLLQSQSINRSHSKCIHTVHPPRPSAPLDMLSMPSTSPSSLNPRPFESTDPTAIPLPGPLSISVVLRKRLEMRCEERKQVATPDQTTLYNSEVMREYQELVKGESVTSRVNIGGLQPTLPHYGHFKPTVTAPVEEIRRKRYSSARRTERSQVNPERRPSTRRYRFTKRELSGSFHITGTVFDPHDIYNVSNGTIRVT